MSPRNESKKKREDGRLWMDVGDPPKKRGKQLGRRKQESLLCAHKIREAEKRKWGKIVGGFPSH